MSQLVRTFSRNLVQDFIRGPKKVAAPAASGKKVKGKAGSGEVDKGGDSDSGHVFNIFGGVADPQLQPDDAYPGWLWSLADRPKSYSELSSMFIYGVGIEKASEQDYRRFLRQHRKLVIKVNNSRLRKSKSPIEDKIRFP